MIRALLTKLGLPLRTGEEHLRERQFVRIQAMLDAADIPNAPVDDRVALLAIRLDAARTLNTRLLVRGIQSEDRADRAETALSHVHVHARTLRGPIELPAFLPLRSAA